MAGLSGGSGGGISGGASGLARSGISSSLQFGRNAGIGNHSARLSPTMILLSVIGLLILLLFVFRVTK